MVDLLVIGEAAYALLQLVLFALALGLTLISFQAYRQNRTKRLEFAFIGFAFISMGVAVAAIVEQVGQAGVFFDIAETVPFIVGFAMLYLSLYR